MGSVLISALRLVDVFSDDSNFRSSFITNTIPFLTQILATPHDEFVSSWCSVDLPVMEDDANLDYDPVGAADLALLAASNMLTEAKVNYSCNFRSISMPSIQYADKNILCGENNSKFARLCSKHMRRARKRPLSSEISEILVIRESQAIIGPSSS